MLKLRAAKNGFITFAAVMGSIRFQYIDRLKGIVIFLVVMEHVLIFGMNQRADSNIILSLITSLSMPMFMFLSGWVIKQTPDIRKVINKLICFLCPMVIVGVAYTLFLGVEIKRFFLESFNFGYWYLQTLATFYVLILLFRLTDRLSGWIRSASEILLFFLVWVGLSYVKLKLFVNFHDDLLNTSHFYLWPYFAGGFLLRKNGIPAGTRPNKFLITGFAAIYIALFVLKTYGMLHIKSIRLLVTYPDANAFLIGIFAVAFIFSLLMLTEQQRSTLWNIVSYIGRNTLDIYVFHYFFIHILSVWGAMKHVHFGLTQVILALTFGVIVTFCAIAIGKLVRWNKIIDKIVFGKFTPFKV